MIKDEEYINFLKSLKACVDHGDYFSIKELSNLKLEEIKSKKYLLKEKNQSILNNMNDKEIRELLIEYSNYVLNTIYKNDNLKEIREKFLSIEEFIKSYNC